MMFDILAAKPLKFRIFEHFDRAWERLTGIAVFLGIIGAITPPTVSIARVKGAVSIITIA